jgi:hypothetical protein
LNSWDASSLSSTFGSGQNFGMCSLRIW